MKKRAVVITTQAHRPHLDAFIEAINAVSSREGWRSFEVLTNFLEAGYRAVRAVTLLRDGDAWQKNEDAYIRIVKSCRHPQETMRDVSRMLAELEMALAVEPVDFLGPVSEISASSEMGQFFTPNELSLLMARMIVSDARVLMGDRRYITLQEPACGVGGMMLATNVALREQGIDVAREAHWLMIDVDFRAHCGAYLQASLSGASAVVVHGNTLSLEQRSASITPMAMLYPKRFEDPAPPSLPASATDAAGGQLSLF